MRLTLYILIFFIPLSYLGAQPGKAKKAFDQALGRYQDKDFLKAVTLLTKALDADPEYTQAYLLRADSYRELQDTAHAIEDYKKVAELNPDKYPGVLYSIGFLSFYTADYQTAFSYLAKYLGSPLTARSNLRGEAYFYLRHAEYAKEAIKRPLELHEKVLNDSVNTNWDEYVNDISLDGTQLFFTRKQKKPMSTAGGRDMEEDFYTTRLENGQWVDVFELPLPLNSPYDEGALDISPDGNLAIFASNRPDGLGRFDLYFSIRNGDMWGPVLNLGPNVNGPYWDSQPNLAPDGRTLYFVSNRPGGLGQSDIWVTRLSDNGTWSPAKNLGTDINSQYNEMTPVIHPDGKTLYFASEFHPGFGRFDLFVTRLQVDGSWSTPVNLGYPLNTVQSEFNFVIHPNGRKAYFSRYDQDSRMDIVEIDLPEYAQPEAITYAKGFILDDATGKGLEAIFRLVDLETGDTIVESMSESRTGSFLVTLPSNRNYGLFAERTGYMYHSENFYIEGENPYDKPFRMTIRLKKIGEGSIVLKNVFFDVDKYDLKPQSNIELDKFVAFMKSNPLLNAEVGGHTDNTGSAEHNQTLSMNRARAVYDYLVAKGIDSKRLSYKGYGMDKPIDTNETAEGRANNRRTEINFIK